MQAFTCTATRSTRTASLRPCAVPKRLTPLLVILSRGYASETSPPGPSTPAATVVAPEDVQDAQARTPTVENNETQPRTASQKGGKRGKQPKPYQLGDDTGFVNLMTPQPELDLAKVHSFPAKPHHGVNHPFKVISRSGTFLHAHIAEAEALGINPDKLPMPGADVGGDEGSDARPSDFLPSGLTPFETVLVRRRVVQQTGKGKIARAYALVCVGNGNGLVGYGEGKDGEWSRAFEKARIEATRNMDRVERFEGRTIFTELRTKLGATQIILRPRPVGFGLRCNPNIHPILKAAGIKDASAKVWGSRNKIGVIKATFRMLQAGHAPVGMGNGFGGPARRLDQGSGVRTKGDVERERGRRLLDLRT